MMLRPFILMLCLCGLSCGEQETKKTVETTATPPPAQVETTMSVRSGNNDFDQFLDRFNKDSVFQTKHIQYPLKFQQYDQDRGRTVVVDVPREGMQFMDFSKASTSDWTQQIISTPGSDKATIEIRGVGNGIITDYHFEKRNGNWMLILINDQST